MAFFNNNGRVIEVGNPDINPQLTAGATALNSTTLADARTEAASSPTINRSVDPAAAPTTGPASAEQFLNTFRQPESREQIAERKRRDSQQLIDAINKNFDDEVTRKKEIGQQRVNMDNAISVLTGNMGGTESVGSRKRVLDANEKEVQAVNNQRALALAEVFTQISADADKEAREQLTDATRSAEQILARRKESQGQAIENLKLMAASGFVDFDAFKSNPQSQKAYQYALDSVGGDETALRALFMLNRPQEQLIGDPIRMGGKYVQAYQNPLTGKVTYEQLDLPFDLPPEYTNFQKMGDNLVAIPEGWDGDVTKLKTIVGQKSTEDQLREQSLRMDIALKEKQLGAPTEAEEAAAKADIAKTKANKLVERALTAISDLKVTPGRGGAIGAGFQKTLLRRDEPEAGTKASDYLAKLEQVKALLSFPDLENMKGLGPMSEREFGAVQAAAGALNKNMSEGQFNAELTRIEGRLNNILLAGQLAPGEILVKDRASGQVGAIPENEFDGTLYEPL